MGDLFQAFLKSPDLTQVCATLALILAATTLTWGAFRTWWWNRAASELRQLRDSLNSSESLTTRTHRQLYRSFNETRQAIRAEAADGTRGLQVVDDLLSEVRQYHLATATSGVQGWDDIAFRYLQRHERTLAITKAAASWAVLLGLAGTVLGFVEAIPALRDTLSTDVQEMPASGLEPPSLQDHQDPEATDQPDREQAVLSIARGNLVRVLDSLGGVFFATFFGVLSALLLYMFSALVFQPVFDSFSDEVELLGQRWFVPLIETPSTILDDTLRNELQEYFAQVGEALDATLKPLVKGLSVNLSNMSDIAGSFSANIETGRNTLETFHSAVEKLGRAAGKAVDQVVGILQTSREFLQEVRVLQEEGGERLTQAVARFEKPATDLASSTDSMRAAAESLLPMVTSFLEGHEKTATAQRQHAERVEDSLRELIRVSASTSAPPLTSPAGQDSASSGIDQLHTAVQDLRLQLLQSSVSGAEGRGDTEESSATARSVEGGLGALQADQIRILEAVRNQLGRMGQSLVQIERNQRDLLHQMQRQPIGQAVRDFSHRLTTWDRSPVLRWLRLTPRH